MNATKDKSDIVASPIEEHVRTMTVMFTDMADSSRFAELFGGRAALRQRKRHNRLLAPLIERADGILIEAFGDSLLAVFERAEDAANCAIAMQRRLAIFNRTRQVAIPEMWIRIRLGIHTGRLVLARYHDYFEVVGRAVNTAARVEASAENGPGQILLSETTRRELHADNRFRLETARPIDAKGIGRLQLFRLCWAPTVLSEASRHLPTADENPA